ncbi:P-loop containing nucleoside triphosphate hydrolase protein, partial [Piromyces finnis]
MFINNYKTAKVSSNTPFIIESHNLCKIITDICGVLLPNLSSLTPVNKSIQLNESSQTTITDDRLILTPTTRNNLHSIAFALSIGSPILLEGVSGSGKTCLIEEMARLTNHEDLITIHLGDQTDSKVLLGTYVCTNIPGQFRWQPGVLTTAVTEGRWILIEDINLAPLEVISVLIPLLQTRTLFIPSRGEKIKAADGFQIFATQTLQVSSNGILTKKSNDSISENLWTQVRVQHLSLDEIRQVLTQKYPSLLRIIPAIVNTTDVIINHWKEIMLSSHIGNRLLSLRDIMKWAFRINQLIQLDHDTGNFAVDQDTIQKIFLEAADCFTAMIPQPEARMKILTIIGEKLNLSPHSIEYIINNYNPELKEESHTVTIGRVNLPAHQYHKEKQLSSKGASKSIFAHTVHSLRTLEKIAVSTYLKESVLLVGETGAGKTTIVQYLAELLGQKLVVVNLSQQSESSDLLGGFKPVDVHLLVSIIQEKFIQLFSDTFPTKSNKAFIDSVKKVISRKKWEKLIVAYRNAIQMSKKLFKKRQEKNAKLSSSDDNTRNKKMKKSEDKINLEKSWKQFEKDVDEFELQYEQIKGNFLFSFIEGSLVKAIQQGYWILLDEINLASSETLESLSGLLQGAEGSIILTERGDTHPIKRHPNFRIFGCMNPATDVGKKDLPPGLRSRFTEFYVDSLDIYKEDLTQVVHRYLEKFVGSDQTISQQIVEFYFEVKKASKMNLYDGANHRPHFSMRTLTRSLSYATQIAPVYGLKRSLYEGIVMTFLTQLDAKSASFVDALAKKYILANMRTNEINTFLKQIPKCPSSDSSKYDLFQSFWLEKGEFESPEDDDYIKKYIITPSVDNNMKNLARAIYSRKFPVLIQGPTSSGKTSMVEYIARRTHHRFVRINNHEHTDLQEYLGMYVSDSSGQLVFQEGVLVEALRKGYWIVLDELNLAPTDVLEALNRLLDDNRELLINETQEIVKPHPHFMLFATQNPSGLYGGRKALSRAFKNRFLELNFDDFPENELEQILEQRCQIPPSYCKKLVIVYKELQQVRQKTRMFEGRHSFITLRDLFRWAERHAMGYQELAQDGFMILGERIRKESEKAVVKQIIEKAMKVKLVEEKIYDCESIPDFTNCIKTINNPSEPLVSNEAIQEFKKVVWNKAMKRLFTLVSKCIQHQEPVLLVGETGCGKTTVCQVLAAIRNQKLHIVNCHQHTETSDFLGDQRPHQVSRIKGEITKARTLFEWKDGPLISAMKQGDMFLLDEISLADDSVLERLNSVLEPKRQLVLAEKGGKNVEEIVANKNFLFLATMNPGGDYGKKELSPALRNRFTEIWVPQIVDDDDLLQIMNQNLTTEAIQPFGKQILNFITWFSNEVNKGRTIFSLRDILSWINFINLTHEIITPEIAFLHGGSMVFLDGLGINPMLGVSASSLDDGKFRKSCEKKLISFANINKEAPKKDLSHAIEITNADIINNDEIFGIYPFTIPKGKYPPQQVKFDFKAPTTLKNTMRVLRALQLKKPILLEGSPGVGKTSLIANLASVSGCKLVRINLSEQTDLMDLFGSDLPVEGGSSGEFSWRDGLFLKAMQEGDWVLLDELNLASQSVLEGLNACLDHRATVYIPELDKTFSCSPEFRVFGAQNPQQQGGGRKGLPKSFLNRFTQVYVDQLGMDDLLCISQSLYPDIGKDLIEKMIKFNCRMHEDTMINYIFGRKGAPWEFNLRDVFRWIDLTRSCTFSRAFDPTEYIDMVYIQRMRTHEDREYVKKLYLEIFGEDYPQKPNPNINISNEYVQIGHSTLPRQSHNRFDFQNNNYELLTTFLKPLESLMKCVELNWMAILTGATATGKTSMVRLLANITGNELFEFSMNSGVDTMELLGGFEQFDINRHVSHLLERVKSFVASIIKSEILKEDSSYTLNLLSEVSKAFHLIETTALTDIVKSDTIGDFLRQLKDLLERHQSESFMGEFVKIQNLYQNIVKLQDENVRGSFEWIDGILLQALENGNWLLIDNANYCNPSVLDRLNGLLEPNGLLFVNERGLVNGEVKTVRPHPNFRIFLTVDPKNGEISRAMRNRGVEIALIDALAVEENSSSSIESDKCMNMVKLFNSFGIPGQDLPNLFSKLHQDIKSKSSFNNINPYKLILCGKLFIERVQRGQNYVEAAKETINLLYLDQLNISLDQVQIDVPVYDDYTSILAPLSWPYFVSGDFIKSSPSLAMVCYHGSFLYFILKCLDEKKTEFFGDNIDPKKVLDASFRYFVINSTLKDWTYRVEWLKYI